MATEKHTFHPIIDSRGKNEVKSAVESYEVRRRSLSGTLLGEGGRRRGGGGGGAECRTCETARRRRPHARSRREA